MNESIIELALLAKSMGCRNVTLGVDKVLGEVCNQSPWISVSERLPDAKEGHSHVYVFTPEVDKSMRYRVVPTDLFKQVCTDATHWQYCTAP